jgi:diaminopimelate decarboxylase
MFNSDNLSINELGHLTVGEHDAVELARKFGTPLYVLDEDLMRKNCREYKGAIDSCYGGNGLILFASKALCTMYTSKLVADEGLGADAVSGGELYTLYKAGFPMDKVFFHGNNKTRAELELALSIGVGHIVVDNKYELALLNQVAGEKGIKQKILFRIKPGIDAHTHAGTEGTQALAYRLLAGVFTLTQQFDCKILQNIHSFPKKVSS